MRSEDAIGIKICQFRAPAALLTFGQKALTALTTDDIEVFRDARESAGLSPVTVNHDLKLLRKMFNWAIRKGYMERSPFKIGTEAAITEGRELRKEESSLCEPKRPKLAPADSCRFLRDCWPCSR
jgi:Phage integrase SAM-like domain